MLTIIDMMMDIMMDMMMDMMMNMMMELRRLDEHYDTTSTQWIAMHDDDIN